MSAPAAISLVCGALWAALFYMGIRHRDPWSIVVVGLAWVLNLLLGQGNLIAGGIVRTINTGLIVLLLIDRLQHAPQHVGHVAAAQVADARHRMHEAENDRAAWEARAVGYRRLLEKHGIHS